MLTKTDFIIKFSVIMGGGKVSDKDFNKILDVFKMQRLIDWDYMIDESLSQVENILKIVQQNTIKFYEMYLGQ